MLELLVVEGDIMHIGCCENCRYLDLFETLSGKCPRCGARVVSLGIESSHWNSMSEEARNAVIAERFPRAEDNENIQELFAEPVKGRETEEDPEEAAAKSVNTEFVYVCYKCNTISGHDGQQETYYCPECGCDMVAVGCSTDEWAEKTKEEKRKLTEEAKIAHMVSAIKEASFDENEKVSTPNIINVVKN